MSSGQSRIIINTCERAVSTDINRLQAFIAKDRQQELRRRNNRPSTGFNDYANPGLYVDPSALPANPSYGTLHDVHGGLMVRPDLPTDLLVDPGSAGFFFPGYTGLTSEDSPYIMVDDAGVQTTGVLTFTGNASGFPRIDIVECQPVDTVIESSNRDIYDPLTGLFTPALVEKVRRAVLSYRIRLGTPNACFPDLDQSWLPLAFIVMQDGAANFTECDFYDVRPLVAERTNQYGGSTTPIVSSPGQPPTGVWDRGIRPTGAQICRGWFRGAYNGYYVGGLIRRNTPSSLADFGGAGNLTTFDASAAANQAAAPYAPNSGSGMLNALVAYFPKGLGRCVRYGQANASSVSTGQVTPAGRLPQGANGILFLARPASLSSSGAFIQPSVPSIFGAAADAGGAIVVGWFLGTGAGYRSFMSQGKKHFPTYDTAPYPYTPTISALPSGSPSVSITISPSGSSIDWGTNANFVPCNVARVLLSTNVSFTLNNVTNPSQYRLGAMFLDQPGISVSAANYPADSGAQVFPFQVGSNQMSDTLWLPMLPRDEPTAAGGPTSDYHRLVDRVLGSNQISAMSVSVYIMGWEDN